MVRKSWLKVEASRFGEVWYKLIFDVFIYADRENDDHAYRHLDKHYEMAILLNAFIVKI